MPGEGRLRQDGADQGQRPKVLPTTGALKPLLGNQLRLTSWPSGGQNNGLESVHCGPFDSTKCQQTDLCISLFIFA